MPIRQFACAGMWLLCCALPIWGAEPIVTSGGLRFEERSIREGSQYVYGLTATDIDADGDLDFTTADARVNNLLWHENDGRGNLTTHVISENDPGYLERHDWGDINGDGKLDVAIVLNKIGHLLWFEQGESPTDPKSWTRHVITTDFLRAYDVELADLDRDGDLDLAASAYTGDCFAWFENPGDKSVTGPWQQHLFDKSTDIANTRTVVAVDFNRDGKLDLLGTGTYAHQTLWYENTGESGKKMFRRHVIDGKTLIPTHGHPVDLDGDGDQDVIMASGMRGDVNSEKSNQVAWYENLGGEGSELSWKKHFVGRLPYGFEAVAGDLDGDGDLDLIASACNGGNKGLGEIRWYENTGDVKGTWTTHEFKPYSAAVTIIVTDFDADGKLDLACGSEDGTCHWWRNLGPAKGK